MTDKCTSSCEENRFWRVAVSWDWGLGAVWPHTALLKSFQPGVVLFQLRSFLHSWSCSKAEQPVPADHPNNTDKCKIEMLAAWLEHRDNIPQKGVPPWSVLQASLRRMGENDLADKIIFWWWVVSIYIIVGWCVLWTSGGGGGGASIHEAQNDITWLHIGEHPVICKTNNGFLKIIFQFHLLTDRPHADILFIQIDCKKQ